MVALQIVIKRGNLQFGEINLNVTAISDDFEEMEALLLEQEALSEDLERERKEKSELEKARLEQEKKQEEMRGTIKNLEEEIVNVRMRIMNIYRLNT